MSKTGGRPPTSLDVAQAVAFLAFEAGQGFNGATLRLDRGMTITGHLPGNLTISRLISNGDDPRRPLQRKRALSWSGRTALLTKVTKNIQGHDQSHQGPGQNGEPYFRNVGGGGRIHHLHQKPRS